MAIAYDNSTFLHSTGGSTTQTQEHTPVGTPRAVVVLTAKRDDSDDTATCTYGGDAMTEVTLSPLFNTTNDQNMHCFFLGTSIPTGAQDAVVTWSASSDNRALSIYSFTADDDCSVVNTDTQELALPGTGDQTETITLGGVTSYVVQMHTGELGSTFAVSPLSGWTERYEEAAGGDVYFSYSYDTISTSDVTWGFATTSDDDWTGFAIAVQEDAGGPSPILATEPVVFAESANIIGHLRAFAATEAVVFSQGTVVLTNANPVAPIVVTAEAVVFNGENLALQSEDIGIGDPPWELLNCSIVSDAAEAPLAVAAAGNTVADEFVEASDTAQVHRFEQDIAWETGRSYVYSCYAKENTRDRIQLLFPGSAFPTSSFCSFNLNAGTIFDQGAGLVTATIQDAGDGWFRCSILSVCDVTTTTPIITRLLNAAGDPGYNGDGSSSIYYTGAQVNRGAIRTYIPTTTTAIVGGTADLFGRGLIETTEAVVFGSSADLGPSAGLIEATEAVVFGSTANISSGGMIDTTEPVVFGESADITGHLRNAAGTVPSVFGESANIHGRGVLDATEAVVFGESADIAPSQGLIEATEAVVFDESANIFGRGSLLNGADSAVIFGVGSATLVDANAVDAVAATEAIVFGESANIVGHGLIEVAAEAVAFATSANIVGQLRAAAATEAVIFAESAALFGRGAIEATEPVTFDESADIGPSGGLIEVTEAVVFGESVDVIGHLRIGAATEAVIFGETSTLTDAMATPTSALEQQIKDLEALFFVNILLP